MSSAALWRLPEEALLFDDAEGRWKVMAARGRGEARAVFMPLRRAGDTLELAIGPEIRLQLTPIPDGQWTTVLRQGGAEGCVYLCVLRYDLPSNHPDDTFKFAPGAETVPGGPPPADVAGAELQQVLERLRAHGPRRIALDAVDGPEDRPAEEAAARAVQAASRGMARSRAAVPTPTESPHELSFAFGSCQYPAGMLDREIAHGSYAALARHLEQPGVRTPERLLLLGDQVYVDATYGLLDPARLDDRYRMPYEDLRDRDDGPFSKLPLQFLARMRSTPDDHEFQDNWEPWAARVDSETYRRGLAAFWEHQRRRPGGSISPVDLQERGPGWHLFMADTRTERGHRTAENLHRAVIMKGAQRKRLECFLAEAPEQDLKIVTSPAMLLPRTREYLDDPLYLDGWQGYPFSFHRLLAFVCDRQVRNLVFLSGDTHLACSAHVRVSNLDTGRSQEFVSHHAPALYAPYPFANENRFNLLLQDSFQFTTRVGERCHDYECSVRCELLVEGQDGCGLMTATREGGSWSTRVDVLH